MPSPSVLFVPGMMLDAQSFAAQLTGLAGDYEPSVADITQSSTIEALARDALRLAPARFALVGLSLGGIVALEMYRQAPERITHLALLDTTPHADRPERSAKRLEEIAEVESGALAEVLKTSLKPLYLAVRNRTNPTLLETILQMGLRLGPHAFRNQSLALRNRRSAADGLASISCPALVLCGREDQLCPVQLHVDMADAIVRADLVVLSETGHLSSMEEPAAVTQALSHLLQRT